MGGLHTVITDVSQTGYLQRVHVAGDYEIKVHLPVVYSSGLVMSSRYVYTCDSNDNIKNHLPVCSVSPGPLLMM